MNFKHGIFAFSFLLCFFISVSGSFAATETYDDAVTNAKNHAITPGTTWLAASGSIVTISDTSTANLQYDDNGNIIVRSATKASNFYSNYVGQANYTIYGNPTSAATWVTTGNDFTNFYDNKGSGATNTALINLIERGLGMTEVSDTSKFHNAIVELTVAANNNTIMRPTRNPDIATYNKEQYGDGLGFTRPDGMSDAAYNNFVAYYDYWRNRTKPTGVDPFPWSQLGYTYFWGNAENTPTLLSQVQGMSEFIILGGTSANIYAIYATASYIYTKNNGQYGNGYANFNITGDCDTVWAGHSFQKKVSRSASSPNEITIASGATMSGGEGILVWSLNYTVNNSGTISGATRTKYGVTGTDNIAVYFQGDTSSLYGTPILVGKNTLINSGSITSLGDASYPGIGVYVANGDTVVTNSGTISSEDSLATSYGIWLTTGANSITNSGDIGTISGGGDSGTGIRIDGGNTTITNNTGGTIYGNTYAIRLTGGTNAINNYADITGVTAIQIDGGTTTVTNSGAGTITGNVVAANNSTAALNVGSSDLTITGDYTQNAAATFKVSANSATDFGSLTATNISNASSNLILTPQGYIPDNTTFADVMNGTGVSVPGNVTSASPVFSVSGSVAGNKLSLTALRANSYNSFASNSNSAAAGAVLNTIAVAGNPQGDMLTVLGNFDSMTSAGEINGALNTLLPNIDNSVPQATQATQEQFVSTILAHLDGFKNVINGAVKGLDMWASGFGSYLHQDEMSSSNGYNATVWGTAVGGDIPVWEHLRAGLSGGYAQDYVRTKDSSARTDIDSYQGTLYASYSRDAYYIDTAFSFAYNSYDTNRQVAAGALNRRATGDYNGQQYSGYIAGGYKFTGKRFEFTPIGSFLYSHLRLNSYTEDGAGALSLKVNAQDYNVAQTGLGMKVGYPFYNKALSSKITPELKFKWLYDWVGDAQQATSAFTGGGASFSTQSFTPAQSSYDFGAKITLETNGNITISLDYDLEIKEDFYAHYGYANIRSRF